MSFFEQASQKKFGGSSGIFNKKRNKPEGQLSDVSSNAPSKFNRLNPHHELSIQSFTTKAVGSVNDYDNLGNAYNQNDDTAAISTKQQTIHQVHIDSHEENDADDRGMNYEQLQGRKLSVQIYHSNNNSNNDNENGIVMETDIQSHIVSPLISTDNISQSNFSSLTPFEAHNWKEFDVENIEVMIKNSGNDLVQYKQLLEEGTRKVEKYTYDINDKVYSILYNCDSTTLLPNIISTNKKLNDLHQKIQNLSDNK